MHRSIVLLFTAFLLLALNSCYERQEACTDINAVNFNPLADDPCCCNYPALTLQLQHRYGADSIRFFADSTYLLDSGTPFKVLSFEFLADELILIRENGEQIRVEEEIAFVNNSIENCPCIDDVFSVNLTALNTSPGTFSKPGAIQSIKFSSGLSEKWSEVAPADYPSGHPLALETRYDFEAEKYRHFLATVVFPETADTFRIRTSNLRSELIFEGPFELFKAQNTTLTLRIDYQKLLGRLDEVISDPLLTEELIRENLKDALKLFQ
ncbi:MAG: hypothetical protein EA362_03680 [Saprospirales bacterium]|nr:MAG: hypothetical protein EA362_03680 [Saprospirales bacterium]